LAIVKHKKPTASRLRRIIPVMFWYLVAREASTLSASVALPVSSAVRNDFLGRLEYDRARDAPVIHAGFKYSPQPGAIVLCPRAGRVCATMGPKWHLSGNPTNQDLKEKS